MSFIQRYFRTRRNKIVTFGLLGAILLASSLLVVINSATAQTIPPTPKHSPELDFLTNEVNKNGTVSVLVALKSPEWDALVSTELPGNAHDQINALIQNSAVLSQQARTRLLQALQGYHFKIFGGMDWVVPSIALNVDATTLSFLESSPLVAGLSRDHAMKFTDADATAQTGANWLWNYAPGTTPTTGYTGNGPNDGQVIAVIDTGVDPTHPYFVYNNSPGSSRVLSIFGACFSGDGGNDQSAISLCPPSCLDTHNCIGTGAGNPCTRLGYECWHGTEVAGLAAGWSSDVNLGSGIAKQASILPILLASYYGGDLRSFDYDLLQALNYLLYGFKSHSSYNLAAVNISISFEDPTERTNGYVTACDSINNNAQSVEQFVKLLRAGNTAVVASSGDVGYRNPDETEYPGCLTSVISVGSVNRSDQFSYFSDDGSLTHIFALGESLKSSAPGGSYVTALNGTSYSSPQVAGAIALLDQETNNSLSVDKVVNLILDTGRVLRVLPGPSTQVDLDLAQAGMVALTRRDFVAIYRGNAFYLSLPNLPTQYIPFGTSPDDIPIVGDWTGSGFFDSLGVYSQKYGLFTLCNATAKNYVLNGIPQIYVTDNTPCAGTPANNTYQVAIGNPGDLPLSGRWYPRAITYALNSNGVTQDTSYSRTGLGVERPTNGLTLVKLLPTTGYPEVSIVFGVPGDVTVSGDWNNDGQASLGVYRPSNANWYLTNELNNGTDPVDLAFTFGPGAAGDTPVVGNWLNYDSPSLGIVYII